MEDPLEQELRKNHAMDFFLRAANALEEGDLNRCIYEIRGAQLVVEGMQRDAAVTKELTITVPQE